MSTFRENLRRGRSHIIIALTLLIAGSIVVSIEDRHLAAEAGKPVPENSIGGQAPVKDVG